MEQYTVTGMSCAACQARVEKAVRRVKGVSSVSVSLLTNSMGVEGSAGPEEIIKAVEDAGYGAAPQGGRDAADGSSYKATLTAEVAALQDKTTPLLKRRLSASLGFLLVLMYFSMGHMMWGWPLPAFYEGNHVAMGLTQLLLTIVILFLNRQFFVSGFKSLFHGAPNMDTLIALGAGAAFSYSTVMLFAMTRAQADGDMDAVMACMMEFYFESVAMIVTLITVGKMLESYSKGKTTNALKSLMKLAPKTAAVLRDGQEITVPVEEVRIGEIFVVRPGEQIPVDGEIIEGSGAVDESALTGESIPVDKAAGDPVSSATINRSGFLKCRALKVGEDTTLAQIIQMVSDAAATKAPVAKLADRISGIFVPAVIGLALLTFAAWMLLGKPFGYSLARAISVLVVSCPCALGLATPVAIMVGNGVGAKNGILFKHAEALQECGSTQIVVLDKTGTITNGAPVVTDILPAEGVPEERLLQCACALEKKSEHPLAKAVAAYCAERPELTAEEVADFSALPGNGLQGVLGGKKLYGGNAALISRHAPLPAELQQRSEQLSAEGKTALFFAEEKNVLGVIAVADTIKEDSPEAIRQLRDMGLHVVMLTGDHVRTAEAIGAQAGVDEVIAGVLPEEKAEVVEQLQKHGKVAMVGDGINDAPALTKAECGIAIGAGTDVAIDAADVVLVKSRLSDVPAAIRLSRASYRNILENLFWALFYNVLLIRAAMGVYVKLGITMNPMFGAAAMSLSSFCVVSNALRLNLVRLKDASHDRKRRDAAEKDADGKLLSQWYKEKQQKKEEHKMEKTITIEGMMCGHCEATVKKALEGIAGVESAEVSHEKGTAVVKLSQAVADEVLSKAVEDKDYTVKGIA